MLLQEYNYQLLHQYNDVNKAKRKFDTFFHSFLPSIVDNLLKRLTNKITNTLVEQLLKSRGLLAIVQDKVKDVENVQLDEPISLINKLIKVNADLKTRIEEIAQSDNENRFPQIHIANEVLEETIDNLYDTLRFLKKRNIKPNIEQSNLALESSKRSLSSLQTVLHGRRST